jgi:hypothetical protein
LRTLTNANEYRYGQKGIWKGFRSNVYLINRLQSGSGAPYLTKINQDGEYSKFDFFQWGQGAVGRWTWASQVTRVNPYGYTLETQDKLGIFSSSLLAHNNSVSSAGASNCEYYELAFDGFEDYGTETTTSLSHGHLSLFYDNTNRPNFSSLFHTGKNSISLSDNVYLESSINGTNPDYFRPLSGKEYLVSAWFYHIAGTAPSIEILVNGSPITTEIVNPNFPNIDGWTKVDVKFTCPTSGTLKVRFIKNGATALDDLRIHPFKGAMTASVYHPLTLWKLADLDNQNMATYYNYDEEGNVVQVKKETIRGVLTIATSRSNLKKQ